MPAADGLFPVVLTQAQRKIVAILSADLSDRLKLDAKNPRTIRFSREELREVIRRAKAVERQVRGGETLHSLSCLIETCSVAVEHFQGIVAVPASIRLYQFKITLLDARPLIWRRILVKNCTLDKLHEHIQTAMGWTNSHLHHFKIDDQLYGDPMLVEDNWDMMNYEDSTRTKLGDILPKSGKRFQFEYEYDFGDGWRHEILFEGCVAAERGKRYPRCLEGARACPPEDVGGTAGYKEYVIALADPEDEKHEEFLKWRGQFDSEAFDLAMATKRMKRGLPDWRSSQWI